MVFLPWSFPFQHSFEGLRTCIEKSRLSFTIRLGAQVFKQVLFSIANHGLVHKLLLCQAYCIKWPKRIYSALTGQPSGPSSMKSLGNTIPA